MPLNFAYGPNIEKITRYQERKDIMDTSSQTLMKRVFWFGHKRIEVTAGDVFYYSFQAPPTKHLIINNYTLKAAAGPVDYDTFEGADFTPGTPLTWTFFNGWRGYPSQESTLTYGATYNGGGVIVVSDFIAGATNKVGSAQDSASPVILPPTASGLFRVTNNGGNGNVIRFSGVVTEILLPDYLY